MNGMINTPEATQTGMKNRAIPIKQLAMELGSDKTAISRLRTKSKDTSEKKRRNHHVKEKKMAEKAAAKDDKKDEKK